MERRARPSRRRARALLIAAVAGLALLVPASAQGAPTGLIPNWPELLPPLPGTPSGTVPLDFDVCPGGGEECPHAVVDEMIERWGPLDSSCDHDAVFALTYLRTTEEFVRTVKGSHEFSDIPWINHEDTVFAELYFRAYDNWHSGNTAAVPGAWKVAFESAESPDQSGIGDLLLGLNAHISRDLPYTLAHVGLVKPDGTSRKRDHDLVNDFLERIADPLQVELAQRYDTLFEFTDLGPLPVDEEVVLTLVKLLRENAWRNAELLVSAPSPEARQAVSALIELEAELFARSIDLADTLPGYGATRDAHCALHPFGLNNPNAGAAAPSSVQPGSGSAGTAASAPASKPKKSKKSRKCKRKHARTRSGGRAQKASKRRCKRR